MLLLLSLVSTLAAAAAPAQPAGPGDDFHWHGVIAKGKTLEIRGINGDVIATAAKGNEAEVSASKRARHSDPASVEIRVVQDQDGVIICAVYPNERDDNGCEHGRHHGSHNDNNDVEVRFTVAVPAGVTFVGSTVNGSVHATGLDGEARATTVNGDVEVSSRGTAEARTVNGSVRAAMGRADWSGTLDLQTVNGDVDVDLPANPAVEVRASTTNGDLESDFPLTIQGRFGPRHLSGTIGGGGRTLQLSTVNGSIHLRQAR
jgi:hypothetical protein